MQQLSSIISGGGFGGSGGVAAGGGNTGSTAQFASQGAKSNFAFGGGGSYQPSVNTQNYNASYLAAEEQLVGDPYGWGKKGPNVFDCTGAMTYGIMQVTGQNMENIPGTTIYNNYTTHLSSMGGPGTLIFYDNTGNGSMDHVTTVIGNGQIIDPNAVTGQVSVEPATYESNYTAEHGGTIYYGQLNWQQIINQ